MLKKIVYIKNHTNRGVSAGWNQGIKSSLTNFMLVVNNDIVFDIDCIDVLVNCVRTTILKLVAANHEDKKEGGDHQVFWSCFLLNKEVVDKVGYFDEVFWPARGEDEDYHWRCDIQGIPKGRLLNAKVWHENNGTAKFNTDKNVKNTNWAHYLGKNLQYLQKKKKLWGY